MAVKEYFPVHIASRDTTSGRSQDVMCFDGKDGKFFQSGLERFKKRGKRLKRRRFDDSVIQVYDYLEENKNSLYCDGICAGNYGAAARGASGDIYAGRNDSCRRTFDE